MPRELLTNQEWLPGELMSELECLKARLFFFRYEILDLLHKHSCLHAAIRETTTNTDQSTIHAITFSPLRTSHGGQYTCRGSAQSYLLVNATAVSITQNVTVTSKGHTMCVASL